MKPCGPCEETRGAAGSFIPLAGEAMALEIPDDNCNPAPLSRGLAELNAEEEKDRFLFGVDTPPRPLGNLTGRMGGALGVVSAPNRGVTGVTRTSRKGVDFGTSVSGTRTSSQDCDNDMSCPAAGRRSVSGLRGRD